MEAVISGKSLGYTRNKFICKFALNKRELSVCRDSMAGETGVDREGPSPPGPINSVSWVGPGGTQYITKMGPFYFSWTVFQHLQ